MTGSKIEPLSEGSTLVVAADDPEQGDEANQIVKLLNVIRLSCYEEVDITAVGLN